jgi:hypothetical protein
MRIRKNANQHSEDPIRASLRSRVPQTSTHGEMPI